MPPTEDQQRVLNLPAPRVRVVRAAPGSGKTWLVAELIRQEIGAWAGPTGGVAALSFTRVGGAEIQKALGYELSHPHFVGTIDAFVFRYVVRPFLSRCFPSLPSPRLIPADWSPNNWGKYTKNFGATTKSGINVFGCVFIGENNGNPALSYAKPFQKLKPLSGEELDDALKLKNELWRKTGFLTHSDAAFWASKILHLSNKGHTVIDELARRFPLFVVDELQDTGYFLSKTLIKMLDFPRVRAVVVGDPDQAIYEFNGARPNLFEHFEKLTGAHKEPLSTSLRCPPLVAAVATHLKDSMGVVGPAYGNLGRAVIIRGDDMVADITRMIDAASRGSKLHQLRIIARQNSTVDAITGRVVQKTAKLNCPSLSHALNAVLSFKRGKQNAGLAGMRVALDCALFGHESVSEELHRHQGIDERDWKRLAAECLLTALAQPLAGTVFDWQAHIGKMMDAQLLTFCEARSISFISGKLKPQKREGWDAECSKHLMPVTAAENLRGVPVTTVHAVKGETHAVTVFVCPAADKKEACCSSVWWSSDESAREERRIAYVATTRTRGDLFLWVGSRSFDRLQMTRRDFVGCFEQLSLEQALELLN